MTRCAAQILRILLALAVTLGIGGWLVAKASAQTVVMFGMNNRVPNASDLPPFFQRYRPQYNFGSTVTYNPGYVEPFSPPDPLVLDNPYYTGPPISDVSKPDYRGQVHQIIRPVFQMKDGKLQQVR